MSTGQPRLLNDSYIIRTPKFEWNLMIFVTMFDGNSPKKYSILYLIYLIFFYYFEFFFEFNLLFIILFTFYCSNFHVQRGWMNYACKEGEYKQMIPESVESALAVLGPTRAFELLDRVDIELIIVGNLLKLLDIPDGINNNPGWSVYILSSGLTVRLR